MTSLTGIILALSLVIIMMAMGLSLAIDDFKRVAAYPKAVLIGLISQMILLPLIGFLIAYFLNVPPAIAIGIMLLAACPGGATSNMITYLAKGDLALSISLTAIASLLSFISIPLIMQIAFDVFLQQDQAVSLDFFAMLQQLFLIIILPVSIGMIINKKFPHFTFKIQKPVKKISAGIFIFVVLGVFYSNRNEFIAYYMDAGVPALLLNVSTMSVGFMAARMFRLPRDQTVTITIESGIQNGTLAITIATILLNNPDYTIVPLIYGLLMFITASVLIIFRKRSKEVGL